MGYFLLWIEDLAFWLLLIACALAVAVRLRRRWMGILLVIAAVGLPLVFWGAASLMLAHVEFQKHIYTGLLAPAGALLAAVLTGATFIVASGLRRGRPKQVRASLWQPGWLAAIAVAALLAHGMTFWNLDLAVRQQMDAIQAEARTLALSVLPPAAPDRENAALLYQQAFDAGLGQADVHAVAAEQRPEAYAEWLDAVDERPSKLNVDDPALAAYLQRQAPLLRLVRQASELSTCRFNRDWARPDWAMLLPEVQYMRGAARDLQLDAYYRAGHGDARGAMENILTLHHMAEHVGQEPILITVLVSFALDAVAAETLEGVLQTYPVAAEDLAVLDAWVLTPAGLRTQRAFRMEEAFALSTFGEMAEWRDLDPVAEQAGLHAWGPNLSALYRVFFLTEDLRSYRHAIARVQNTVATPYQERQRALDDIEGSLGNTPMGVVTRLLLPAFGGAHRAAASADARQRLVPLAIAAHRYRLEHGEYPATLAELTASNATLVVRDPFSDEPLRLLRKDDRLILYSIGANLQDDHGELNANTNLGDIAFTLRAPGANENDEKPAKTE